MQILHVLEILKNVFNAGHAPYKHRRENYERVYACVRVK